MAYNHNTGEYVLNGRTYTPGGPGARTAFRTIRHYAEDTTGLPVGIERDALLAAVRMYYRLPLGAPAFQLARGILRALREETAALAAERSALTLTA
ncbi:hypothetical protein QEH48_gp118 [Streptomyces phage TurkishDelight]|uniref:Uncharacterized protein n=1 Tax=Streptomyces phage TurkishDelight TaxID=2793708 RepID=A0A7T0M2F5_9CAUD|nr:hypothetical protein QEH48_gp118 [Streptomyces phage TurkishDelight]QPL14147.1 hypothetical protein SEA_TURKISHDELIGHT_118 [Streptomyces phage TurkishDelight]